MLVVAYLSDFVMLDHISEKTGVHEREAYHSQHLQESFVITNHHQQRE